MALTINTNVASIRTNRAIEATQKELSKSVERISSGIRLNSAKDDPAGLATADRMSVQIRGISMAIRNANDGISLAQTAEGALQEVTNMLQRIQELAVQASNPSNSVSTRASLQEESVQLNAEITRISNETEFNGQKLLSGDIINANFQIGLRPEQVINLSIPEMSSSTLGNFYAASDNEGDFAMGKANLGVLGGDAPTNLTQEQAITLRGFNTGLTAPTIEIDPEESAKSIVRKINDVEGLTGVNASAKTTLTLEELYDDGSAGEQTISFRLYGKNAKGSDSSNAAFVSASITEISEVGFRDLVSSVNAEKNTTGITASYLGKGKIEISNDDGANISIEGFANSATLGTNTALVTGSAGTLQETLTEGIDSDSVTVGGVITFNSPKPFSVSSNLQAVEGSLFNNVKEDEPKSSQFNSLANIDVSTIGGAAKAINVASNALEQITGFRGNLGSIQKRFETTIATLESMSENTQAARSRLMDTDFAEEVSRFTRGQILQQAGIAILAQANSAPFAVLELLRG